MPNVFRNAFLEPKALVKPAARYVVFSGTNIVGWHLDLPPPRHRLPHWVNLCVLLVKVHSQKFVRLAAQGQDLNRRSPSAPSYLVARALFQGQLWIWLLLGKTPTSQQGANLKDSFPDTYRNSLTIWGIFQKQLFASVSAYIRCLLGFLEVPGSSSN